MSKVMTKIKRFIKPYRLVLFYAGLFYLISFWQSDAATLRIVGAIWAVTMTLWATSMMDTTKEVTEFEPYLLRIWVKPYEILTDLGLMSPLDKQAYAELSPEEKAKCAQKVFSYTVLGPKLVHCATEGQFAYFEFLNLHHQMVGVVMDWDGKLKPFEFIEDKLDFFFQLAPDYRSYEFGVKLSVDWWNQHRLQAGVSSSLKTLDARCNGDLILGTVPMEIPFDEHNGFTHKYLEISGYYLDDLKDPFNEMNYKVGIYPEPRRVETGA